MNGSTKIGEEKQKNTLKRNKINGEGKSKRNSEGEFKKMVKGSKINDEGK